MSATIPNNMLLSDLLKATGTVNWDADNKTLTYTPNPSYPMGSTPITFILF